MWWRLRSLTLRSEPCCKRRGLLVHSSQDRGVPKRTARWEERAGVEPRLTLEHRSHILTEGKGPRGWGREPTSPVDGTSHGPPSGLPVQRVGRAPVACRVTHGVKPYEEQGGECPPSGLGTFGGAGLDTGLLDLPVCGDGAPSHEGSLGSLGGAHGWAQAQLPAHSQGSSLPAPQPVKGETELRPQPR